MNQFQSWYRMQPRALRAILTINVVIYVLWVVVLMRLDATQALFFGHLALDPAVPDVLFEPWQLVTYNFLHLSPGFWGFLHILFNMLWLVWIGREYEELHGPHRLLALYLLTGIGGGLLTVLFYALVPSAGDVVVYGASASVIGVMMAVAIKYPFKSVALIFIGTVRLLYVVLGFLVLDLLLSAGSSTAVTAHVGGALFGFLYAKAEDRGWDLASWARIFFPDRRAKRTSPRGSAAPSGEKVGVLGRMEAWLGARGERTRTAGGEERKATVYPLASAVRRSVPKSGADEEVDRILDKISEHGYDALSDEEKRLLYEASRR